jgi:hypothetical protein
VVEDFISPHEHFFNNCRSVDGCPTNRVVKEIYWFVPRADGDTSAATRIPFFSVAGPENQAAIGFYVPFFVTRICVD